MKQDQTEQHKNNTLDKDTQKQKENNTEHMYMTRDKSCQVKSKLSHLLCSTRGRHGRRGDRMKIKVDEKKRKEEERTKFMFYLEKEWYVWCVYHM